MKSLITWLQLKIASLHFCCLTRISNECAVVPLNRQKKILPQKKSLEDWSRRKVKITSTLHSLNWSKSVYTLFWIFLLNLHPQTTMVSLEGLTKVVDPSQLTADFDGSLDYNHEEWIEVRLQYPCTAARPFRYPISKLVHPSCQVR